MNELVVHWDGNCLGPYSLDIVNRELIGRLVSRHNIRIATLPQGGEANSPPYRNLPHLSPEEFGVGADIVIRHRWPPTFQRAGNAYYIHWQPWEYGALPVSWRDALLHEADEIWCNSNFVRNVYLDAGFDPERVTTLPLGFDPTLFHPQANPEARLPTERSCVFLFVGGFLGRKGFDIVLDAYQQAFTRSDDVALVIKCVGSRDIYRFNTQSLVDYLGQQPNLAEIVLYDQHLDAAQLGDLYRLSTALLHPYRGEGFGLTALEAGACGTPSIYTAGGSMDDFLNPSFGYPIPSTRVSQATVADDPLAPYCAPPWVLEPNRASLVEILRSIAADPQAARAKGQQAQLAFHTNWTWDHAADLFAAHLTRIAQRLALV